MVEEVRNGEGREKRGRVKTEKEGSVLGDFNFFTQNDVVYVVLECCKKSYKI